MNQKKEKILIVDDNDDMLSLLQRHLKTFKYHAYKASSVSEAIDILKYNTIDLLITDLNMPEVNWCSSGNNSCTGICSCWYGWRCRTLSCYIC